MSKRLINDWQTGRLMSRIRLNNSAAGNPRWNVLIETDNGYVCLTTGTNAAVGYEMTNYALGSRIEYRLTRYGRLVDIR